MFYSSNVDTSQSPRCCKSPNYSNESLYPSSSRHPTEERRIQNSTNFERLRRELSTCTNKEKKRERKRRKKEKISFEGKRMSRPFRAKRKTREGIPFEGILKKYKVPYRLPIHSSRSCPSRSHPAKFMKVASEAMHNANIPNCQ